MKLSFLFLLTLLTHSFSCTISPEQLVTCIEHKLHADVFRIEDVQKLYPNSKPTANQIRLFEKLDINKDKHIDVYELKKIHERISCSTIARLFKHVCE